MSEWDDTYDRYTDHWFDVDDLEDEFDDYGDDYEPPDYDDVVEDEDSE